MAEKQRLLVPAGAITIEFAHGEASLGSQSLSLAAGEEKTVLCPPVQ
jgi:hypothetical protein